MHNAHIHTTSQQYAQESPEAANMDPVYNRTQKMK